jgi:16S rRNA G966 N2-methylase RsmD
MKSIEKTNMRQKRVSDVKRRKKRVQAPFERFVVRFTAAAGVAGTPQASSSSSFRRAAYSTFETVDSSHYSSTMPWHVRPLHDALRRRIGPVWSDESATISIIDGTANVGVDKIHFALNHARATIVAVESQANECDVLARNVERFETRERERIVCLGGGGGGGGGGGADGADREKGGTGRVRVVHDSVCRVVDRAIEDASPCVDLVYLDPPWGGRAYARRRPDALMLTLDDEPVHALVRRIVRHRVARWLAIKVPFNFAFTAFDAVLRGDTACSHVRSFVDDIEHETSGKLGFKLLTLACTRATQTD